MLPGLAAGVILVHAAFGQAGPVADVDPYTRGEPEAMARLGYVAFGPFEWADDHTTRDIEAALGGVGLRFLETAHFRIGSSLGAYQPSGDPQERRLLRAELKELGARLPRFKGRGKTLDPWLRLHLFALRAEQLYADFQRRLGVRDDDFPTEPEPSRGAPMGDGPFLGMRAKFTLLLVDRESSIERYFRTFVKEKWEHPKRHHFGGSGTLFFGTTTEYLRGEMRDDTRLHCQVVFNLVHNLADGYRGYRRELPPWWKSGLAQWYLRRIDPRWNNFDQSRGEPADTRASWQWESRVKALVRHRAQIPAAELLRTPSFAGWTFDHHVQAWSRVDFLMSLEGDGFRRYMDVMKDPTFRLPVAETAKTRQEIALERAFDLDLDRFDRDWCAWVAREY